MGRRISIAGAFGLTVVVAFALIVLGRSSGHFGGNGDDGEATQTSAEQDDLAGALQYLAAVARPSAIADPQVITEYVYVDEPAGPPQVTYVTRPAAAGAPALTPSQQATPPAANEAPAPQEEFEDGVPPPVPSSTTAPEVREEQPESGPVDGDQGTVQDEIEFTGTVTSVTGSNVTFATGGGSATVYVVNGLSALTSGTVAKVHALWIDEGWVAKEVEIKDGGNG